MDDHQQHDSKMMWGMMLACALPLVIITFLGSGRRNSVLWAVIGLGGMFILHWVVMRLFHRHRHSERPHHQEQESTKERSEDNNRPACH